MSSAVPGRALRLEGHQAWKTGRGEASTVPSEEGGRRGRGGGGRGDREGGGRRKGRGREGAGDSREEVGGVPESLHDAQEVLGRHRGQVGDLGT